MYYFGKEAIELLDQSADTLIGDFLDPYDFYTTNELDDLREYVVEQVSLSSKFILWKILHCVIVILQRILKWKVPVKFIDSTDVP